MFALQIAMIVYSVTLMAKYGWDSWWMVILVMIGYVIIIIVARWKQYKAAVDYIFMKIFGKPPAKEFWVNDKPEWPDVEWRKSK